VPRPLPFDQIAYHRLRWHARIGTALLALPALYLTSALVAALRSGSGGAALSLVYLGLYLLLGIGAAWPLWRRSYRARPHPLLRDAGPGAAAGVPEIDRPSGRHLGLDGRTAPPTRW
jgi:hypothetical protein